MSHLLLASTLTDTLSVLEIQVWQDWRGHDVYDFNILIYLEYIPPPPTLIVTLREDKNLFTVLLDYVVLDLCTCLY